MSSGRGLLGDIDRALSDSRDAFRALDIELQSASATLARVRRKEAGIYQRLARLRLADIAAERFADAVDAADRRAGELLDARDAELATLERDIDADRERLTGLGDRRESVLAELESAEQALDACLADVDTTLAADPDYRQRRDTLQQAIDTAANAQAKTAEAQARREEKRKPYEQDSLFMYLWQRGYGTSDYRAGLIARWLDGITARHIRFEPARRNYHSLNEIPRRLAAHTERLERKAGTLATELAAFERAADVAAGCEPLEHAVAALRTALQDVDADIERAQAQFDERIAGRERYASAADPLFREAMQLLGEQFRAEPVPQLRREAALTGHRDDDALVEELAVVRAEQERLSRYLDDHRDLHGRRAARVNELTTLRRRYRERNYDAENSLIDKHGKVDVMLHEFLSGLVSGDQLWQAIRHAQRFRRSRASTTPGGVRIGDVRIPRMPRGIRLPRGGGGGGGFRTKGGF